MARLPFIASLFAILLWAVSGCGTFGSTKTVTKVVVVPADEYIVSQVYTNRYGDAIKGYFVPASKLDEFNRMKKELDFLHGPEYYLYSNRPKLLELFSK